MCDELTKVFAATAGLIVLDQVNEEGWGVVGSEVREHLDRLAQQNPEKLMFIDSRAQIARFRHGTLKPNVAECLAALKRQPTGNADEPGPCRAATLPDLPDARCFAPWENEASWLPIRRASRFLRPEYPRSLARSTRLGLAIVRTAGIVSALLSGGTSLEAAMLGNLVASITVEQLGTTGTASPQQVRDRWQRVAERK